MVRTDLSAGMCDTCIHCGIMYGGNGVDEPIQTAPYCPKTENEIIPVNDKHKEMRITECKYYDGISVTVSTAP